MVSNEEAPVIGGMKERIGLLGWVSLYVSGGILFFFLMVHVLSVHFLSPEQMAAETVFSHYRSGFLIFISFGLLAFGALHSMIGLRRVVLDLNLFGRKGDRVLLTTLTVIGVVVVVFGIVVFNQFVSRM